MGFKSRSNDLIEERQSTQYSKVKKPFGAALLFVQIIAISMAVWHLIVLSGLYQMTSIKFYAGHLAFAFILVFLVYPFSKKSNYEKLSYTDFFLGILGVATCLYVFILYYELIFRIDSDPWLLDLIVGGIMGVLVIECTRRSIGLSLPIVTLGFIIYSLIGNYLPGLLQHGGYSIKEII
jgi:TRAP-type uncharacterized transport system fused permease subunit